MSFGLLRYDEYPTNEYATNLVLFRVKHKKSGWRFVAANHWVKAYLQELTSKTNLQPGWQIKLGAVANCTG
jgi:hypothetical protein